LGPASLIIIELGLLFDGFSRSCACSWSTIAAIAPGQQQASQLLQLLYDLCSVEDRKLAQLLDSLSLAILVLLKSNIEQCFM
jgi:hypothetical protein